MDERVSAWEHGAHTMLHVTTAIPRTLALGHIACHLNGAADVAVLQVNVWVTTILLARSSVVVLAALVCARGRQEMDQNEG